MRYVTQTGIAPGDILYVVGAYLENGSYQGQRLRSNFITLDTSCRKRFGKLMEEAKLEHSFKGMYVYIEGR